MRRAIWMSGVVALVALAAVGCSEEQGIGEAEPTASVGQAISVLNDPRFRSYTLLPISTAADENECENTRLTLATGKEPLCAVAEWWPEGCKITGLKPGCVCYEGQAHACNEITGGTCQTGAPNCGIRACLVNNDNSSLWSACSLL